MLAVIPSFLFCKNSVGEFFRVVFVHFPLPIEWKVKGPSLSCAIFSLVPQVVFRPGRIGISVFTGEVPSAFFGPVSNGRSLSFCSLKVSSPPVL